MHNNWLAEDMADALKTLRDGGVIVYPTDTIWGIGCDATNEEAIAKVNAIKNRSDKPLIVLAGDIPMVKEYVQSIHPRIETLLSLHERPLTIIYKSAGILPARLSGSTNTIGIRIPVDAFCLDLIEKLGKPIVSTSANLAGSPFPTSYSEIDPAILEQVDYVVKYRRDEILDATPSVVASFDHKGVLQFIRS